MSNALITKAFEFDTGSSVTKIVLVKLCDNASDEGFCWPSHDRIATHCNLTKKSVITHIDKLIEMGLLRKTNRFQDNKQKANMYEIDFRGVSHDGGVNITDARGVSHANQGCTTFTQNPKENPKKEPKDLDSDFETFYSDYPRHVGKGKAKSAYATARTKASHDEIMRGIFISPRLKGNDPQYLPFPATWLNQESWLDEAEVVTSSTYGGYTIAQIESAVERLKEDPCTDDFTIIQSASSEGWKPNE